MKHRKIAFLPSLFFLASAALWAGPPAGPTVGAVYTMTNAAAGNEILVFDRAPSGSLTLRAAFDTGGLGTGMGLGNQAGLLLSEDGRFLLAVNAGSDQVSVFRVRNDGLELRETADSGGVRPVSLALHGDLLYVLHAGGAGGDEDGIVGFRLEPDGTLMHLAGSTRPLSGASTGPAQVSFRPDGRVLVVTEKATSNLSVFTIDHDGYADGPLVHPSEGMTPFGFSFGKRGQLLVSEAFGGAPEASAVTSYELDTDGNLTTLDPSVPTTETAACWLVVSTNGRYAYTTNTGSGSVTGYAVRFDGTLGLLDPDGVTGMTGAGSRPIDMALTPGGRFLYTLNGGNGTISGFRTHGDGSLTPLPPTMGLPMGANGLAAR